MAPYLEIIALSFIFANVEGLFWLLGWVFQQLLFIITENHSLEIILNEINSQFQLFRCLPSFEYRIVII